VANWQQTRSDFDYKTIAICVRIWLWICRQSLLAIPADWWQKLNKVYSNQVLFSICSQSAVRLCATLLSFCHQSAGIACLASFVIFLTAICWQYLIIQTLCTICSAIKNC